jgi:hypothetical protein
MFFCFENICSSYIYFHLSWVTCWFCVLFGFECFSQKFSEIAENLLSVMSYHADVQNTFFCTIYSYDLVNFVIKESSNLA